MAKFTTLIIIPTYNETSNIVPLIEAILKADPEFDVLVIDDSSPDGTAEKVRELESDDDRVHLLLRPGKLGLGTAHIRGMKWALERDYERVVTMDADFSHPPEIIPAMVAESGKSDVVVGSRYIEGGGWKNWPWHRVLISWLANVLTRHALGLSAMDCTGAFRCFRREVLEDIPFEDLKATGFAFQEEMLFYCKRRGWTIGEVPIIFHDRRGGTSKITPGETLSAGWTLLRLLCHRICGR